MFLYVQQFSQHRKIIVLQGPCACGILHFANYKLRPATHVILYVCQLPVHSVGHTWTAAVVEAPRISSVTTIINATVSKTLCEQFFLFLV